MICYRLLLLCAVIGMLVACSDGASDATPGSADSVSKQDTLKDVLDSATAGEAFRSEVNEFVGYVPDSQKIVYRTFVDTVYGYRKANNDTLNVEGDIMYVKKPASLGVGTTHRLWNKRNAAGALVIPYVINSSYADSSWIHQALAMWKAGARIEFVHRRNETAYIEFVPSIYTRSFVGMIGERQPIELASWARKGNIAHEIGHALGLYHEQTRKDRDTAVTVPAVCSQDVNYRHAYRNDPYAADLGKYNFGSIMHYPFNDCLQPKATVPPGVVVGQRTAITSEDYASIKAIYRL